MNVSQREYEILLPIGYSDESGNLHRQAVIRKMSGHEETLLYDSSLTTGKLVTKLIHACLVKLGNLDPIDAEAVKRLYTADRNYLLLELRRFTLGDQLQTSYLCPRCGSLVTLIEDLSKIEVRHLDEGQVLDNIYLELQDGYLDRQGVLHSKMTLALPRGTDEEFVASMAEKDPLKAQDALVLRCIKGFGTLSKAALEAYGVKILRDLTLGDRRQLYNAFNGQMPGVDFKRSLICNGCGAVFEEVLDVSNFFSMS